MIFDDLFDEEPPPPRPPVIQSVTQVCKLIAGVLADQLSTSLRVQGEISNFKFHSNGHGYFTLKDAQSQIACVMWRDAMARVRFKPQDGMEVIARATVRMYEAQGKLQLSVFELAPRGQGNLELAFRQLCEKLRAEGLFAQERKRPIPPFPQRVLILTSPTGDVIHDVLTTAYRRFPGLHTLIYPVAVQGKTAAAEIVRALDRIDRQADAWGGVDLILLVRGGGSLEDLWPFNDERLARAIVGCRIPIATGIGHEPDTTIADLVGDLRGPTPTGVTELTIPDAASLLRNLEGLQDSLARQMRQLCRHESSQIAHLQLRLQTLWRETAHRRQRRLESLQRQIQRIEPRHAIAMGWRRSDEAAHQLTASLQLLRRRLSERLGNLEKRLPQPRLDGLRDRVAHLESRLKLAQSHHLARLQVQLTALSSQLQLVSPQAVLQRGFSITQDAQGRILRSVNQVQPGDELQTLLADGRIHSQVRSEDGGGGV